MLCFRRATLVWRERRRNVIVWEQAAPVSMTTIVTPSMHTNCAKPEHLFIGLDRAVCMFAQQPPPLPPRPSPAPLLLQPALRGQKKPCYFAMLCFQRATLVWRERRRNVIVWAQAAPVSMTIVATPSTNTNYVKPGHRFINPDGAVCMFARQPPPPLRATLFRPSRLQQAPRHNHAHTHLHIRAIKFMATEL